MGRNIPKGRWQRECGYGAKGPEGRRRARRRRKGGMGGEREEEGMSVIVNKIDDAVFM